MGIFRRDEILDAGPDHALQGNPEHGGELIVGEEDQAVKRKRQCAFRHVLNDNPVCLVGASEGVDAVAVRTGCYDGVDFSVS